MTEEQINEAFQRKVRQGMFKPVARFLTNDATAEDQLQDAICQTWAMYCRCALEQRVLLDDGILVTKCRWCATDLGRRFVGKNGASNRNQAVMDRRVYRDGGVEVFRLDASAVEADGEHGPNMVRPDSNLFTIADLSSVWVWIIVDAIDQWVDARIDTVAPKSPLGVALTYAKNQRQALRQFLADPKLPLDNNASERALRIIAVGRKNFLFVGHEDGGHNLAVLQTICSTCLLHRVNPYQYIRDIAVRVQA